MPTFATLAVFIPTMFFISITPGMCMTLAMTLGLKIGLRRTMWMMLGEVCGVAIVAVSAVMGAAAIMLNYPTLFVWFKWIGGLYLIYLGCKMFWVSRRVSLTAEQDLTLSRYALISQGFLTAIANPKGWAFMLSILPPFINGTQPITFQLLSLVIIIMLSEFICMLIYATGGKGLKTLLNQGNNIRWMNGISGTLLIGVGVWLALS
ncbi:LysE family translocator [Paraglaciecola sp. MB-3u-78]|jgi:homoserine/homoserine lactone efflux protein|uniref:LysE family translocator n=1 Tax=Paraglaciecola sp. MB-3u-78 TaxID=2058332 RepID=UPI000C32BCD3|nr:LysE family translocator [Paraglaciecola sp. MB-3u-78]PKG99954.1 threonine transporter RhtB [Paraglaciecola sp. MB-3u-78]